MTDSGKNKSSDLPVTEAEAILEHLRSIPPQNATGETVAEYKRAVSLLLHVAGSPLWFEAQTGLGSHLIESPHGDRADNIESAKSAYRAVLEYASPNCSPDAWESAVLGLANSLWIHPSATQKDKGIKGSHLD